MLGEEKKWRNKKDLQEAEKASRSTSTVSHYVREYEAAIRVMGSILNQM